MREYLSPTSRIVKHQHFENGIVKIQKAANDPLTEDETRALEHFLIQPTIPQENTTTTTILSPCEKARLKRQKITNHPQYRSVKHVLPTSNMVERLFSQTKYIMTDNRKQMNPEHLNEIMILKYHRSHWNVALVQSCMRMNEEEKVNDESKMKESEDI